MKISDTFNAKKLCQILILSGLASIATANNHKLGWKNYYNRAMKAELAGKYDEAIKLYDRAIASEPNNADAHYEKGVTLGRLGRRQEAINCYDKAIAINPNYYEAYANKSDSLSKLGRYEEAINACDALIALVPSKEHNIMAHYNKGATLERLGRYQEVIDACDVVIALEPRGMFGLMAYHLKGINLSRLNRHQEAIDIYDKTMEAALFVAPVYSQEKIGLKLSAEERAAFDSHRVAIQKELYSSYIDAIVRKGIALDALGRYDEAIDTFNHVIASEPDCAMNYQAKVFGQTIMSRLDGAKAYHSKGITLGKLGRYDEALDSFDRAIALDPSSASYHNKGRALRLLGRLDEAKIAVEKAEGLERNRQ